MTLEELYYRLEAFQEITLRVLVNPKESIEYKDFHFSYLLNLYDDLCDHDMKLEDIKVSGIHALDKDHIRILAVDGWDFKKWDKQNKKGESK